MNDDILAHLDHIQRAANSIKEFINDKTFEEYQSDELFRSGVERNQRHCCRSECRDTG